MSTEIERVACFALFDEVMSCQTRHGLHRLGMRLNQRLKKREQNPRLGRPDRIDCIYVAAEQVSEPIRMARFGAASAGERGTSRSGKEDVSPGWSHTGGYVVLQLRSIHVYLNGCRSTAFEPMPLTYGFFR